MGEGCSFAVKSAYDVCTDGGVLCAVCLLPGGVENAQSSQIQIFVWWIAHGRLPTWDKLSQFLLDVSPTYCLCSVEEESLDHLFVICSCSQGLWPDIAWRIGKFLSWRGGDSATGLITVGIVPWLVLTTRVSKFFCQKLSSFMP
ncbi:hypothetical protein Taro_019086 [Colocasia esculenta]|uniref:Reverse transcriptase zinc-binding domain-containing protein n=1 Tax=Colocasia esculenta TaxID=4460 RepID=A0A843UVS9_COLES|nr:hypothetical protein [Colocasia esculenta]